MCKLVGYVHHLLARLIYRSLSPAVHATRLKAIVGQFICQDSIATLLHQVVVSDLTVTSLQMARKESSKVT